MDKKIVGILITFIVRSVMIATGCYLVQLYISKKRKSRVKKALPPSRVKSKPETVMSAS